MSSKSSIAIAEIRAQAVAKEIEKKQNLQRLKWFEENYEKVYLNPSLPKERVPKKAAVLYEELRNMRLERFKAERDIKEMSKTAPKVEVKEDFDILDPMYPVPGELKAVLCKGVSHDEEGRYKYLKLRNKDAPFDKFRGKDTSNWEYGWKIQENSQPALKDFCQRSTWQRRVNGAFKNDDPLRRPPFPSGLLTFPFL